MMQTKFPRADWIDNIAWISSILTVGQLKFSCAQAREFPSTNCKKSTAVDSREDNQA